MTYDEFFKKYNGRPIDFDGYYGNQCMDLYRQYVKEVIECPQSPGVNGAKDVWNTYLPNYFDRIPNTPDGVPQKGDIVIWGVGVGPYGHIAIFDSGDANSFKSFDQNWPVGTYCHLQQHNYNNVLGWLRKKAIDVPQPPQVALNVDLGGLQTALETYGIISIETLKSKLVAKDSYIKNHPEVLSSPIPVTITDGPIVPPFHPEVPEAPNVPSSDNSFAVLFSAFVTFIKGLLGKKTDK